MNEAANPDYKRSLETLHWWAQKALKPRLIAIARTNTPNASYNRAVELGENERTARATRWLAMIRRDYGVSAFEAYLERHAEDQQL